jgi:hypothetical protein
LHDFQASNVQLIGYFCVASGLAQESCNEDPFEGPV